VLVATGGDAGLDVEVGLDVDGITQAALSLAMAVGWSPPEPETDAQAKAVHGPSTTTGSQRGVLAGNEPSRAR